MKRWRHRLRWLGAAGVVALVAFLMWSQLRPQAAGARKSIASQTVPRSVPPTLLPAGPDDGQPVPAWRRLLAADGSPREDLVSLQDLVANLLQQVPVDRRPPIGFDRDLARALSNPDFLGDAALPATHPALRDGRLIDRWGNPWLVHPLSHDVIQVRSAGPDGRLFTADDFVAPRDVAASDNQ